MQLPKDAAEMIGLAPDELMVLDKPMYGQIDAPRQWFSKAKGDLLALGLRQHPFDPCVFLSYNDQSKVDGFVLLYVDDLMGAGDLHGQGAQCWKTRLPKIKAAFQYRM